MAIFPEFSAELYKLYILHFFKVRIHPKIIICWKCPHPQAIQDVDDYVSSSEQI